MTFTHNAPGVRAGEPRAPQTWVSLSSVKGGRGTAAPSSQGLPQPTLVLKMLLPDRMFAMGYWKPVSCTGTILKGLGRSDSPECWKGLESSLLNRAWRARWLCGGIFLVDHYVMLHDIIKHFNVEFLNVDF